MRFPETKEQRLCKARVKCDQCRLKESVPILVKNLDMGHDNRAFVLESCSGLECVVGVCTIQSRIIGGTLA